MLERTVWPRASTPCATAAARSRGCLLLVMDAIAIWILQIEA